jgi:hypothetical protein
MAGQPMDDDEIALMLARSLINKNMFDVDDVHSRYVFWLESGSTRGASPFQRCINPRKGGACFFVYNQL